jgi:hypothetical protein
VTGPRNPARFKRPRTASKSTVEVNRFLGYMNRDAMHNRPAHPPTDESHEIVYLFFEHCLK